jgi:RNA polymerase sigma factor (sigma-70 family)
MSEMLPDLELIMRISHRDEDALKLVYERYERPIYTFAYRIVKDAMLAEEVVQELFMRIWNSAEKYDAEQGKLSSWMFTLTRNIAIDWLRRKQSRTSHQVIDADQMNQKPDLANDTAQVVEAMIIGDQVRDAMLQLSADQQQVVEMIYYGGYTQQEVSLRCNIPLGTVKSRVRLAMRTLKKQLGGIGKEGLGYDS